MYVYLSKKKHRKNKPETNKIGYIKDKDGIAVEGEGFEGNDSLSLNFCSFHFCHVQNNFKLHFDFS